LRNKTGDFLKTETLEAFKLNLFRNSKTNWE